MSDESTLENKINNLLTLGMEPFSTIRTQRMERNGIDHSLTRTPRSEKKVDGMIRKRTNEKWKRNNLAVGPRSRTECNNFKTVGKCPAIDSSPRNKRLVWVFS